MLDPTSYLARIAYSGPTVPTAGTLRALHRAHLLAVPFENLDIALGRRIVLDEDEIIRKIVERRRGGFCYELNGAFAALLRALGFNVALLSARVSRDGEGEGPEFDHLALRVDLDDPWLADVGFGDSFLEPLKLKEADEQIDPVANFRLIKLNDNQRAGRLQLERAQPDGQWKRQYSFSLQPRRLEDFAAMCHYHQTSPESHFTQNSVCTLATVDGRTTLSGTKLIMTRNGQRMEIAVDSENEHTRILREQFGITL